MTCSAMQVRRLAAGEFAGAEKEALEQHVAACAKCNAVRDEIAREKEALLREVPFPAFAAGVAEKLAQQKPRRSLVQRWAPFAAAAGLLIAAGAVVLRPVDTETVRSKGAARAQIFVKDAAGVHELVGPVAASARLLVTLHPAGRKYAAAVLVEAAESSVIYDGPAVNGALPQAFEWTGQGPASLVVVLADQPVDAAKLHGANDAPRGADVIEVPLRR